MNYASFLLGMTSAAQVNAVQDPQWRKMAYGLYGEDSWKISRKLTLGYGLRWDLQGVGHEIHYRNSMFGPTVPNPSAAGRPGAVVFEGYGQGRCNCDFVSSYPYAFSPRLSLAYQLDPKTVIRAGWGLSYGPGTNWWYSPTRRFSAWASTTTRCRRRRPPGGVAPAQRPHLRQDRAVHADR